MNVLGYQFAATAKASAFWLADAAASPLANASGSTRVAEDPAPRAATRPADVIRGIKKLWCWPYAAILMPPTPASPRERSGDVPALIGDLESRARSADILR